jgi:hypothetical protein
MSWGPPAHGNPPVSAATPGRAVRIKLETSRDLAKALARFIRASLAGTMTTADLSRYANAISVAHRVVTDATEIEAITVRLDQLERRDVL